jgi:hypothetical protein
MKVCFPEKENQGLESPVSGPGFVVVDMLTRELTAIIV